MHQHPTLSQRTGWTGGKLIRALATADPEPAEFVGGLIDIGWGAFLMAAGSFQSAPSFRLMRDIGLSLVGSWAPGEFVWGIPLIVIGLIRLWALLAGRTLGARAAGAACAVACWFLIWLSLVLANWRGTGTVIYGALLAITFWCLIRLREARLQPIAPPPEVSHV